MSEHKYKTKKEALDAAEKLGCLGYHKMGDDSYMPCKSHERFKKLNSKKTEEEPEGELEEFVDADGTMLSSKIPILDPALHPRKTMDQTVQAARNVYDIFRMGYRRYFSETDMSKAFGYDETKFMNAKETIKYLEKELGLDSEDAEDRAEEMGKKPKMDKKSEFKDLNAEYVKFFGLKPPVRVCVQIPGDEVILFCMVYRNRDNLEQFNKDK